MSVAKGEVAAVEGETLPCPLCEYDLRATAAGRCPECGHAFDADELRRRLRERARMPWFIESGGVRWWSGWATTALALWPTWFWRRVTPDAMLRPKRRTEFAFVSVLIPTALVPSAWSFWAEVQGWGWWGPMGHVGRNYLAVPIVLVGLIVLTAAISAVFQQTLRRAGIKSGHLWRVAIYGSDFRLLWLPTVVVVMVLVTYARGLFGGNLAFGFNVELSTLLFAFFAWGFATWRVSVAYVLYLRLPGALGTALLVQATVALAMFVGIVVLSNPPW